MWSDADSDEKGHSDDYGPESDGPVYDEWWELNDDRAYWRRRFLILCGGVVALGVCAWLLPGTHQPSKHAAAAASASMAALARRQALPSAANGPAWPAPSSVPNVYPTAGTNSPSPTTSVSPTTSASPTISASPTTKATSTKASAAAHHPKPTASPSGAKAGACAPASIVLSLFTSKPSYAKGGHPSFSVYAVSTAATPCTLTYGAGSVQVVVTQRGHVMWDSAACKPTPAQSVRFTLGVPQVLTMVWNPAVKKPAGCAGALPTGSATTLDAVALSHGQSSQVRSFKLAKLAAEGRLQRIADVLDLGDFHRGGTG
jgi:hypothetical protein